MRFVESWIRVTIGLLIILNIVDARLTAKINLNNSESDNLRTNPNAAWPMQGGETRELVGKKSGKRSDWHKWHKSKGYKHHGGSMHYRWHNYHYKGKGKGKGKLGHKGKGGAKGSKGLVMKRFADFNSLTKSNSGGYTPPDPNGAAGPSSIIAAVNLEIEKQTRDGKQVWKKPLADFFHSIRQTKSLTDPHVHYDFFDNIFWVILLEKSCKDNPPPSCTSAILVAKSTNSDPSPNDWVFQKIDTRIEHFHWNDYPGLSFDREMLYITSNIMLSDQAIRPAVVPKTDASYLWILKKSDLKTHAGPIGLGDLQTNTPAVRHAGESRGTYLVALKGKKINDKGTYLEAIRITKVNKNPTIHHQEVKIDGLIGYDPPKNSALQRGSIYDCPRGCLETGHLWALDAVLHKESLWVVFNLAVTREAKDIDTAIWVEIDVSNWPDPTVKQYGKITGDNIAPQLYTYYPSIDINKHGVVGIGFSASSVTKFAGAYFTWRLPSDPIGTTRPVEKVREGLAHYTVALDGERNRWGDYTSTAVDPINEDCFWVFNEFASKLNEWATAWGQFCLVSMD